MTSGTTAVAGSDLPGPSSSAPTANELSKPKPFRVLALDGGGTRGIFTAAYLAKLEEVLGAPCRDVVDLIVGTSTGGIVGLGLAAGRSAEDMLSLYLDQGPEIFARPRSAPMRLLRPKYDRTVLGEILHAVFGDLKMSEP